ncbi:MAG: hypothetical protein R3C49_16225 [Planctomycetaceae bacterium]
MAGVRVTILGEDQLQVSFARRVLKLLSFRDHELFTRPVPDGDGSGKMGPARLSKAGCIESSKQLHISNALLVSIDADNHSIQDRKRQLDDQLSNEGMIHRNSDEPIAVWVPNRNIETWFMHLSGESVDESENYKTKVKKPDLKKASEAFFAEFHEWQTASQSIKSLPSLVDAFEELQRIL